jgi:hypothetical protein
MVLLESLMKIHSQPKLPKQTAMTPFRKVFVACRRSLVQRACWPLLLALTACGGAEDATTKAALQRAREAAAKPVALQSLPALYQCLTGLSQQLKSGGSQDALSLSCLAGRYNGLTVLGEECFLQVDADLRQFKLVTGARSVQIDWAVVAMGADGRPVYNLESSDIDGARPGVQLTRFTAFPEAITETLALRAGLAQQGPTGLPQLSYLRVQAEQVEAVRCRFGA